MRKVMITCAVTGAADSVGKSPHVPVTPEQIAAECVRAAVAGAAIAHIHVRDPATGRRSAELHLYREVVERIAASGVDLIVNLTTGPGSRFVPSEDNPRIGGPGTMLETPKKRVEHIEALHPALCSLDVATFNFGDDAFINTPDHLARMARAIRAAGTKPELECFEPGHVRLAAAMIADGLIDPPPLFQLVLGVRWACPATPESLGYMKSLVPPGAIWAAFGVGAASFPMVAEAVNHGGHVRVGLEDNLYLKRGVLARSNGELVERAAQLIDLLGHEVASPAEARAMLGLKAPV